MAGYKEEATDAEKHYQTLKGGCDPFRASRPARRILSVVSSVRRHLYWFLIVQISSMSFTLGPLCTEHVKDIYTLTVLTETSKNDAQVSSQAWTASVRIPSHPSVHRSGQQAYLPEGI